MGVQMGFNSTSHGVFYIHSPTSTSPKKAKGKKALQWLHTAFQKNFEDCFPTNYNLLARGKQIAVFGKQNFRHPNDVAMVIAKLTKKLT